MPIPFIPPPQPSGVLQGAVGTGASAASPVIQARTARDKIAADLQEAAMRVALGRQQLAQQRQISEMELAAKMQIAKQEALRRESEAAIEKSYKDSQLGLAEKRLSLYEEKLQQDAALAAGEAAGLANWPIGTAKTSPETPGHAIVRTGKGSAAAVPTAIGPTRIELINYESELNRMIKRKAALDQEVSDGYSLRQEEEDERIKLETDIKDHMKKGQQMWGSTPTPSTSGLGIRNIRQLP